MWLPIIFFLDFNDPYKDLLFLHGHYLCINTSVLGGTVPNNDIFTFCRHLSSKPPAPPPPQKIRKCDPVEDKIHEDAVPQPFSVLNGRGLLKPAQEQTNEPQGLVFRKLDGQTLEHDPRGDLQAKPEVQKGSLAHSGETLLATFYGMLYTNDGAEKEWRLEVDGFIPVCFVQDHGNANKPFRIIAVEKSRRVSNCFGCVLVVDCTYIYTNQCKPANNSLPSDKCLVNFGFDW